jgi:DNA adenine methylase
VAAAVTRSVVSRGDDEAPRDPRPIVKWAGGKSRILEELVGRMPTSFGAYHEPFLGGGALFFRLSPERAEISDANVALINMYRSIADDVEGVIARLRVLRDAHAAGGLHAYLGVRARFNVIAHCVKRIERSEVAAMFIYLNKTCFNGLWRVNRSGVFNVPYGKRDDWGAPSATGEDGLRGLEDGLRAAAVVLSRPGVRLASGSFPHRSSAARIRPRAGDFVYCDPPYDGTFNSYTGSGFTFDDQSDLAGWVRNLADGGVRVMVSSSDTPLIRSLYSGLRMDVIRAARSISSDGDGRGKVDELVIMGGYS